MTYQIIKLGLLMSSSPLILMRKLIIGVLDCGFEMMSV